MQEHLKLCPNRVFILVRSVVHFPVLGNRPCPENSACSQNTLTDVASLIRGFGMSQSGPHPFPRKQPSSQNVSARSDAILFHDLCVLAEIYHIIAFQHAQFPKIPLKAFPSRLCSVLQKYFSQVFLHSFSLADCI